MKANRSKKKPQITMKNITISFFPSVALKENMNPMTKENIPNMPQIPSSDSIAMMNDINENKKNMIPKERFVCLSGSISMFEISISYGSIMFEISISYGSIMILGGDFFFF